MRTVVVTGAAGELGRRVVERLAALPEVGRIVAVDVRAASGASHPKVSWRQLDLAGAAEVTDALVQAGEGADGCIHLAWVDEGPLPPGEAAEANRTVLQRVLTAAGRLLPAANPPASPGASPAPGSRPVLVHLSSGTVYGAWPDNPVPLAEDVPLRPNPGFSFAATKAEAERVVAEWSEAQPDVAVAVLRPCAVVGTRRHPLYQALGGTRAPRTDDGGRQVQYVHVDDLADAVVFAWARRLAGVFNVAPDLGTGEATARALAGGMAQVPLPARLGHAVADVSWHLVGGGTPKEAQAYNRHPWVLAPDRLRAAGWTASYTSEEALVAADERSHWDDLPPGKRQEFTLLAGVGALVLVVAAAAGAVVGVRRRGGRRRTS